MPRLWPILGLVETKLGGDDMLVLQGLDYLIWAEANRELAGQLNDGQVYDRDLPGLVRALEPVLATYRRRAHLTGAPHLH